MGKMDKQYKRNNVVYLEAPIDLLIEHGGQYREEVMQKSFLITGLPYDVQKVITFVYPEVKLNVELLENLTR